MKHVRGEQVKITRRAGRALAVLSLLIAGWLGVDTADAQTVLSDRNAVTRFNFAGVPGPNPGLYDWLTDTRDIANQSWFWYRLGGAGPERPIHSISAPVITLRNLDSDAGNERVNVTYTNSDLRVSIDYTLTGGTVGSGISALATLVRVTNVSNQTFGLSFFQYGNYSLPIALSPDTLAMLSANTIAQNDTAVPGNELETVVTPTPNIVEFALQGGPNDLLTRLNNAVPNNLVAGPNFLLGDVTWAMQWNRNLRPGQSLVISQVQYNSLIPEPGVVASAALSALFFLRRPKRVVTLSEPEKTIDQRETSLSTLSSEGGE